MRGEKIYEYKLKITSVGEFGISFMDALQGRVPIPPQGARFDVGFQGTSTGRLSGQITGFDYFVLRADGLGQIDLRGAFDLDDGCRIALSATGVVTPKEAPTFDIFENATLLTAVASYAWVNTRQVWAIGTISDEGISVEGFMQ
ncbi:MAG: DUF3237 family protein [Janthinobacterium lividum]